MAPHFKKNYRQNTSPPSPPYPNYGPQKSANKHCQNTTQTVTAVGAGIALTLATAFVTMPYVSRNPSRRTEGSNAANHTTKNTTNHTSTFATPTNGSHAKRNVNSSQSKSDSKMMHYKQLSTRVNSTRLYQQPPLKNQFSSNHYGTKASKFKKTVPLSTNRTQGTQTKKNRFTTQANATSKSDTRLQTARTIDGKLESVSSENLLKNSSLSSRKKNPKIRSSLNQTGEISGRMQPDARFWEKKYSSIPETTSEDEGIVKIEESISENEETNQENLREKRAAEKKTPEHSFLFSLLEKKPNLLELSHHERAHQLNLWFKDLRAQYQHTHMGQKVHGGFDSVMASVVREDVRLYLQKSGLLNELSYAEQKSLISHVLVKLIFPAEVYDAMESLRGELANKNLSEAKKFSVKFAENQWRSVESIHAMQKFHSVFIEALLDLQDPLFNLSDLGSLQTVQWGSEKHRKSVEAILISMDQGWPIDTGEQVIKLVQAFDKIFNVSNLDQQDQIEIQQERVALNMHIDAHEKEYQLLNDLADEIKPLLSIEDSINKFLEPYHLPSYINALCGHDESPRLSGTLELKAGPTILNDHDTAQRRGSPAEVLKTILVDDAHPDSYCQPLNPRNVDQDPISREAFFKHHADYLADNVEKLKDNRAQAFECAIKIVVGKYAKPIAYYNPTATPNFNRDDDMPFSLLPKTVICEIQNGNKTELWLTSSNLELLKKIEGQDATAYIKDHPLDFFDRKTQIIQASPYFSDSMAWYLKQDSADQREEPLVFSGTRIEKTPKEMSLEIFEKSEVIQTTRKAEHELRTENYKSPWWFDALEMVIPGFICFRPLVDWMTKHPQAGKERNVDSGIQCGVDVAFIVIPLGPKLIKGAMKVGSLGKGFVRRFPTMVRNGFKASGYQALKNIKSVPLNNPSSKSFLSIKQPLLGSASKTISKMLQLEDLVKVLRTQDDPISMELAGKIETRIGKTLRAHGKKGEQLSFRKQDIYSFYNNEEDRTIYLMNKNGKEVRLTINKKGEFTFEAMTEEEKEIFSSCLFPGKRVRRSPTKWECMDASANRVPVIIEDNDVSLKEKFDDAILNNKEIKRMMANPSEQCAALAEKIESLGRQNGVKTITKGMLIYGMGKYDNPTNHFVVFARFGGETFAYDLSIGQFDRSEGIKTFLLQNPKLAIKTEQEWKAAFTSMEENKRKAILAKNYKSVSHSGMEINYHGDNWIDQFFPEEKITDPPWYHKLQENRMAGMEDLRIKQYKAKAEADANRKSQRAKALIKDAKKSQNPVGVLGNIKLSWFRKKTNP